MMGKIMTQLVVKGAERGGRPKAIQPDNQEWVAVIQAINAAGWTILPLSCLCWAVPPLCLVRGS
jgi:hypothetical protein